MMLLFCHHPELMQRPEMPADYIFRPSDAELMGYLALFVAGKPVNSEIPISEKDLYSAIEPWQIFENSAERILYFFTPLNKKSPGNSRYIRRIGDGKGTWKAQDKGKPVYRSDSFDGREQKVLIGFKKSLRYENKELPEHDGRYLMKEYYFTEKIRTGLKAPLKDYVLCRIKRKRDEGSTIFESPCREAADISDVIGKSLLRFALPKVQPIENEHIEDSIIGSQLGKNQPGENEPIEDSITVSHQRISQPIENERIDDSSIVSQQRKSQPIENENVENSIIVLQQGKNRPNENERMEDSITVSQQKVEETSNYYYGELDLFPKSPGFR
ncbi:unnamed protein product [Cuscuta europaea]|uniref:NAC domain-containing protein n=1 Tax=Cuscuta europaea TaxID=41803 RepID=A0A9P0ZPI6_CUSEU|nr:unnamed protein product [Cuscuta europaea]